MFVGKKEKKPPDNKIMTMQILQYEFLGPIKLDDWGPPMEKVVYLILSRKKDSFNIIYVGDCENTDEKKFFVDNPLFKCWIQTAGSENSLYLAILPMFGSNVSVRKSVSQKIIQHYKPSCNPVQTKPPPSYFIRPQFDEKNETAETDEKTPCPCCGTQMKTEKIFENTKIIKCPNCGLSDTRTGL